jgi:hypothetical protein
MTTITQIIEKANEVIRNANFTKVVKARKNAGNCFLIMTSADFDLYGSYSSETVYVHINSTMYKLS